MLENLLLHLIVNQIVVTGFSQDVRAFLAEDIEERMIL